MVLLALALGLGGCMDCGSLFMTAWGSWAAVWAHQADTVPTSLSRFGVGGCGLGFPEKSYMVPGKKVTR